MHENEISTAAMLSASLALWIFLGSTFTVTVLLGAVAVFVIYAISTHNLK